VIQLRVPGAWSLSQPVQRLVQAKYLAFLSVSNEPGRLCHVHLLLDLAVEKGRFHVEVVYFPPLLCSDSEKEADRVETGDGRENLVEIDPFLLDVALCHDPGLVLQDLAMLVLLDLVHPLEPNWAVAFWKINERPRLVLLDGGELLCHGLGPALLLQRLSHARRLLRRGE
jgi:hypothetical protein